MLGLKLFHVSKRGCRHVSTNGLGIKTVCIHIKSFSPFPGKRINNYILYKVCDEITYSFPNFHRSLVMDKLFHPTLYWAYDLSMLGLTLIHVSKRGLWHVSTNRLGIKTVFICIHIKLSRAFAGKRITGFSQQSNICPSTLSFYSSGDMCVAINTWKTQYLFSLYNFTLQYCSL